MAFLQQSQQAPRQNQEQPPDAFRNLYPMDAPIAAPAYYVPDDVRDQARHPPYVPEVNGLGFAPIPMCATATDGGDGGADLQFEYGLEPKRKKLKERDFLDNTSQASSLDLLQARPISVGLGLSLDNRPLLSTGDSALVSLIGDDIDRELHQLDVETNRFLKLQADRMRQGVLQKIRSTQLQTLSLLEDQVIQKLGAKEAEVESINKKNEELEERIKQLTFDVGAWQQRALNSENMIAAINYNLHQIYAQSRDSKEGCGDSEVDDSASCSNGRTTDFHSLLGKEKNGSQESMTCKVCRVNTVSMLLLPCQHLCVCKDCESKVRFCPLCQSYKLFGTEVFM
ncbi:probable BOI-related E3 ubiquitin-protein ligase 2 [Eucalyptus grandis]|uniref:Uncharacterized protein n=2 Tax=Eucalyptus grandis TaxID=71139 RepID=A0ACC3K9W3_EUCGR|nr:probable BOI-related E3 ubiquitin-protein ligase 2 [Eucalyptus grandis]KAK3423238.1 hypothetical protein EUGRSUZ_F00214 [Eucalyptus grandis]